MNKEINSGIDEFYGNTRDQKGVTIETDGEKNKYVLTEAEFRNRLADAITDSIERNVQSPNISFDLDTDVEFGMQFPSIASKEEAGSLSLETLNERAWITGLSGMRDAMITLNESGDIVIEAKPAS